MGEQLILFGINSLIDASREPVKSIEDLRNPDHFLNILSTIEAQQFDSHITISAQSDPIQNKFEFVLQYLSKYSTSSITEWNINELVQGNNVLLAKLALLAVFAAGDNIIFCSHLSVMYNVQYIRLMALFDLHMSETTENNLHQLNIDDCIIDAWPCLRTSTPPDQTTSFESVHPDIVEDSKCIHFYYREKKINGNFALFLYIDLNDSLNDNNHSSSLDRSFTPPEQSQISATTTQQSNGFQEDIFNVQYKLNDLQHKYADLEQRYNELKEQNRELSEKLLQQADYDTIKDECNKLREAVHRYEIENKRLQRINKNVHLNYTTEKINIPLKTEVFDHALTNLEQFDTTINSIKITQEANETGESSDEIKEKE
ncbi:unnamed protein product [Rotaria sp. Silwood2]|nr:unnamed protein product [Rotaria sp. Silwood2]